MYKVGITGGIGSGKTHVCKVFELLGIPVFYADAEAKKLMIEDLILIEGVKSAFGNQSYFANLELNRKHIANIVFNDEQKLAQLNALVHPAVFRAFTDWIDTHAENTPYVLKEAALLFESGADKMCDRNVVVTSPLAIRLERIKVRDQVSDAEVLARVEKQFSDEKKISLAHHHISNDNEHSLIEQVLTLHETFLDLAQHTEKIKVR